MDTSITNLPNFNLPELMTTIMFFDDLTSDVAEQIISIGKKTEKFIDTIEKKSAKGKLNISDSKLDPLMNDLIKTLEAPARKISEMSFLLNALVTIWSTRHSHTSTHIVVRPSAPNIALFKISDFGVKIERGDQITLHLEKLTEPTLLMTKSTYL